MAGLNTRTTSLVESINSQIQRSFPARPSILQFTDYLRLHESMKSTDLYQIVQLEIVNDELSRKRATDRARHLKIMHFTDLLKAGEISIAEFLEAMSSKEVLNIAGKKSKRAGDQLKKISNNSKNIKRKK